MALDKRNLEQIFLETHRRQRLASLLNLVGFATFAAFFAAMALFPQVDHWLLVGGLILLMVLQSVAFARLNRCPLCEQSLVRDRGAAYCPRCGGRIRA